MSKLEYSSSALSVMRRFYGVSAMIFVEGEDDKHFWHNIAKNSGVNNIQIQDVGGVEALNDIAQKIVDEDAKVIVAYDSDYHHMIKDKFTHDRIVYTYGYSIENTLYCPNNISLLVQNISRSFEDFKIALCDWYEEFCKKVYSLLPYDIANAKYQRGVCVLGDSCGRFMKNTKATMLEEELINAHLEIIADNFSEQEVAECIKILGEYNRDLRWAIKGHFLTLAIVNIVKSLVRNVRGKDVSISTEMLYSSIINGCTLCKNNDCESMNIMVHDLTHAVTCVA